MKQHTCWLHCSNGMRWCKIQLLFSACVGNIFVLHVCVYKCVVNFYRTMHYSAKRGLAITCHQSVHLSVHIGWKCWKLIVQAISPTSSLFIAQRSSTYSQGNMEKFWGENVCSTLMFITSGWIELTESHVIFGGGVAVCSCNHLCISTAFLFTVQTMCECERIKQLSDAIRLIPDFPSPGILFRYIFEDILSIWLSSPYGNMDVV